ncbi:MAG TPA: hypothetical protein VGJ16_09685 [Pirellulales bacterium]|jgi:hypothetical protein
MSRTRCGASLLAIAALAACFSSSWTCVRGEEFPTKEQRTKAASRAASDDALLKDLDNELLEGAGDLTGPKPKKPDDTKPKSSDSDEEDATGMPAVDQDPLTSIGERMRSVETLIPEHARRREAESLQTGIVDDLRQLIEQAQQQRAKQQAAAGGKDKNKSNRRKGVQPPKPTLTGNPGKDSRQPGKEGAQSLGKNETERPDPKAMQGLMKDTWGHLPARAREQMLQNPPERFLPQYELMIERYYKRLAEQQTGR